MDNIKFGQFIAARRTEMGFTQAELAGRLHVTNKAVSKWETGKGFPDIQLLEPLADVLDITVMELMQCQKQLEPINNQRTDEIIVEVMQDSASRTSTRIFRVLKWILLVSGLICVGISLPVILGIIHIMTNSSNIGIIGGADGPTAIFIGSSGTNYVWLLMIFLFIGAIICWFLERKSGQKK